MLHSLEKTQFEETIKYLSEKYCNCRLIFQSRLLNRLLTKYNEQSKPPLLQ